MFRSACLAGAACLSLLHLQGNADELLLPAIEPSLTVPVPATCFAPCDETAAIGGKTVAVTRRTIEAPAGEVAVFAKRDGAWTQTTTLANPAPCLVSPPPGSDPLPCHDPVFGLELALSGNYLFVSVEPSSPAEPRAVYVFRRFEERWIQQQRIELPSRKDAQAQDFRIVGLAADGGSLAISTNWTGLVNGATRQYGVVSIFKRAHGGLYGKATFYEWPDADVGAMALDNDTLVVSVGSQSDPNGAVHVIRRVKYNHGRYNWEHVAKLTPSLPGDQAFGAAVAVSNHTIAVGAPAAAFENFQAGRVYIYRRWSGEWIETQILRDPIRLPDPGENNLRYFGSELSLQGRRLMVGIDPFYPLFGEQPLTLLFERKQQQWRPAAEFRPSGQPDRIELSGHSAVISTAAVRFGNTTHIYDLPELDRL
jgi:hypothetical protein